MTAEQTLLLNHTQVQQKLRRLAHEILENYYKEPTVVLVGIQEQGYQVAKAIAAILQEKNLIQVELLWLKIDKGNPEECNCQLENNSELHGKQVLLVDDVLNSGKTLMYATKKLLDFKVKSLHTVVLVNRMHRLFPIRADFMGMSVATTLQEHIEVSIVNQEFAVYLK